MVTVPNAKQVIIHQEEVLPIVNNVVQMHGQIQEHHHVQFVQDVQFVSVQLENVYHVM